MNKFTTSEEMHVDLLRVDPTVGEKQEIRLQELREKRDQRQVAKILKQLRSLAQTEENLMPLILEAVKSYATLGEICGVLREIFGEYKQEAML